MIALNTVFFESSDYHDNNLKFIDLSAAEMIDIVDEFIIKIQNNNLGYQSKNQKLFWEIIKKQKDFHQYHKVFDNCANISDKFLESNKNFLNVNSQ